MLDFLSVSTICSILLNNEKEAYHRAPYTQIPKNCSMYRKPVMERKIQSPDHWTAYSRQFSKPETCIEERTFQAPTGTRASIVLKITREMAEQYPVWFALGSWGELLQSDSWQDCIPEARFLYWVVPSGEMTIQNELLKNSVSFLGFFWNKRKPCT